MRITKTRIRVDLPDKEGKLKPTIISDEGYEELVKEALAAGQQPPEKVKEAQFARYEFDSPEDFASIVTNREAQLSHITRGTTICESNKIRELMSSNTWVPDGIYDLAADLNVPPERRTASPEKKLLSNLDKLLEAGIITQEQRNAALEALALEPTAV